MHFYSKRRAGHSKAVMWSQAAWKPNGTYCGHYRNLLQVTIKHQAHWIPCTRALRWENWCRQPPLLFFNVRLWTLNAHLGTYAKGILHLYEKRRERRAWTSQTWADSVSVLAHWFQRFDPQNYWELDPIPCLNMFWLLKMDDSSLACIFLYFEKKKW